MTTATKDFNQTTMFGDYVTQYLTVRVKGLNPPFHEMKLKILLSECKFGNEKQTPSKKGDRVQETVISQETGI